MVTSVPVDMSYEFPRTELAAMSDNIAKLIQDINKLDGYQQNMMEEIKVLCDCLLYTSPSPRDQRGSRMPSSA